MLTLALAACTPTTGTVEGLVVSVEGSLTQVESFTLLVEGDQLTYVPKEDGDYAFPLPHLREHQRTGEPVIVEWVLEDGVLYALSLDDA